MNDKETRELLKSILNTERISYSHVDKKVVEDKELVSSILSGVNYHLLLDKKFSSCNQFISLCQNDEDYLKHVLHTFSKMRSNQFIVVELFINLFEEKYHLKPYMQNFSDMDSRFLSAQFGLFDVNDKHFLLEQLEMDKIINLNQYPQYQKDKEIIQKIIDKGNSKDFSWIEPDFLLSQFDLLQQASLNPRLANECSDFICTKNDSFQEVFSQYEDILINCIKTNPKSISHLCYIANIDDSLKKHPIFQKIADLFFESIVSENSNQSVPWHEIASLPVEVLGQEHNIHQFLSIFKSKKTDFLARMGTIDFIFNKIKQINPAFNQFCEIKGVKKFLDYMKEYKNGDFIINSTLEERQQLIDLGKTLLPQYHTFYLQQNLAEKNNKPNLSKMKI